MGGQDCLVDVGDILHQVLDLRAVFLRKTITRCVRDVDYGCAGRNHGFHYPCKVFVVGSSGVFSIELYVFDILLCVFDSPNGTLNDFFACGVELVADMGVRGPDTRVDTLALCVSERLGSGVDILLDSAGQRTYHRPGYGFGNLYYRVEITGAGYRKSSLDDIYSE